MFERSFCSFIILVIAALASLNSWSRPLKQILESKRLIVTLTEHDYAPFYSGTKQKLTGFDVSLAQQIAQALGVQLVLHRESGSFPSFVNLLLQRKTDLIISAYQITLDRAKEIKFSSPYFKEKRVFVVQAKNENTVKRDYEALRQLKPKQISVGLLQKSTHRRSFASAYPGAFIMTFAEPKELLAAVKNGSVRFAYLNESIVNQWLRENKNDLLFLRKYHRSGDADAIAVGIHPDSDQLLFWVNTFIKSKKRDQSLDTLIKLFFNENEFKNHEL